MSSFSTSGRDGCINRLRNNASSGGTFISDYLRICYALTIWELLCSDNLRIYGLTIWGFVMLWQSGLWGYVVLWQSTDLLCFDNLEVCCALTICGFMVWQSGGMFCSDNLRICYALTVWGYVLLWQSGGMLCSDSLGVCFALTIYGFLVLWQSGGKLCCGLMMWDLLMYANLGVCWALLI